MIRMLKSIGRDDYSKAVASVVDNDNCSGCGACVLINPAFRMELDDAGFNRPVRITAAGSHERALVDDFKASCPGVMVVAPGESADHPARDSLMGPVVSSWEAWATDEHERFRGSSGGTITALSAWMLKSGVASRVVGARATPGSPSTTQSLVLLSRADVLGAAGSRYAPTSNASLPDSLRPDTLFIGKPCEVSAIRQLSDKRGMTSPVLLSFFCAGVPSQASTDALIEKLGIPAGSPLRTMRYRGNGWPGNFYAEDVNGKSVSTTYDESWGKSLGPTVQWRCKICPDGVGESADIVAGDYWHSDERGYPVFEDGNGISALIARTKRGHELLRKAIEEGVIAATPLDISRIVSVQPLQVARRRTLAGRLFGRALAGWRVPRYEGFGLFSLGGSDMILSLRFAYGSFRRSLKRPHRSK